MEEEAKILHNIKESSALMSVTELAKGVLYTEPLTTGWVVEVIQSAVHLSCTSIVYKQHPFLITCLQLSTYSRFHELKYVLLERFFCLL